MANKTVQPAKHINVIREDAVTLGVHDRRFQSMHRREGLFRLHITGGYLPRLPHAGPISQEYYWAS